MTDIESLKRALRISLEINKTYAKLFKKADPNAAEKKIIELEKQATELNRLIDLLIDGDK